MVAKKYPNNQTANNGGKSFVVGGGSGSAVAGNTKRNYAGNAGSGNARRNNSIKFMSDDGKQLIFISLFNSKSNGTPMVRYTIYDFGSNEKLTAVAPLYLVVKTAYQHIEFQNVQKIGDLTPQPASQPTNQQ
jgi:hypothetical protein